MDEDRTTSRAEKLLPEELAVGSDDPQAQAEAILAESDIRTLRAERGPDLYTERRTSQEAAE
ncbi:hypothetical protein [Catellatospora citrea]|uniref:Uncharacterized protein n=1 Tax=Catellatospora citrea TaxID=53366 RepID=A0A8J3NZQ5_9ACTN|nr:hypothetical protein [Catellatospora citrea]RKE06598.1 hypothetical protein C8E86_1419 [Catellatospora citrea]GIF98593.1 hypothetical protein Cci01nite_36870 [Catellatospora citrea]